MAVLCVVDQDCVLSSRYHHHAWKGDGKSGKLGKLRAGVERSRHPTVFSGRSWRELLWAAFIAHRIEKSASKSEDIVAV